MSKDIKVIYFGGGVRSISLLKHLIKRKDIKIELGIYNIPYDNEPQSHFELIDISNQNHIDYFLTESLDDHIMTKTEEIDPDIIVGGGIWRTYTPERFFNCGKIGLLGSHGSLLPEYKGFCGINWYMLNGESEYGIQLFKIGQRIDSGPLVADKDGSLLQRRIKIRPEYKISDLLELTIKANVDLWDKFFDLYQEEAYSFIEQDQRLETWTCHRGPDDGEINWNNTSKDVFNFIRAQSSPYPGAFTYFKNRKFYIWDAKIPDNVKKYVGRIPGKVVERHPTGEVDVLTGDGVLRIREITVNNEDVKPTKFLNSVRHSLGYDARKSIEALERRLKDLENRLK